MIKILRFIITGSWHEHKREIEDEDDVTIWFDDNSKRPMRYITTYVQKCAICGKLRSFKVKK